MQKGKNQVHSILYNLRNKIYHFFQKENLWLVLKNLIEQDNLGGTLEKLFAIWYRYYIFNKSNNNNNNFVNVNNDVNNDENNDVNNDVNNDINIMSIQLTPRNIKDSSEVVINDDSRTNKQQKYIDYKYLRNKILKSTCHYISLLVMIVSFEYWFFNEIILKYNILSSQELEYLLYKNLNPLIYAYINNNIVYENT